MSWIDKQLDEVSDFCTRLPSRMLENEMTEKRCRYPLPLPPYRMFGGSGMKWKLVPTEPTDEMIDHMGGGLRERYQRVLHAAPDPTQDAELIIVIEKYLRDLFDDRERTTFYKKCAKELIQKIGGKHE